jgi:hypothetical protein
VLNLPISLFAPTVTITDNVLVIPGVLTLSLGLFAPIVSTPRVVTPGLVALSLTTFAPTIFVVVGLLAAVDLYLVAVPATALRLTASGVDAETYDAATSAGLSAASVTAHQKSATLVLNTEGNN